MKRKKKKKKSSIIKNYKITKKKIFFLKGTSLLNYLLDFAPEIKKHCWNIQ